MPRPLLALSREALPLARRVVFRCVFDAACRDAVRRWIFQLGYGFVARDCFQHFCFALDGLCPAAAEDDFGYESETSGPVSGAGAENEFHFKVLETSGPVAGFENDLLEEVAARGQVRRHAHPVGIGHAPLFQEIKEDKKLCLEISGSDVSRNVESPGASGVIFESDVDVSGSLVQDGAFAALVDFDDGSSGSSTEASNEAAIVPHGCSSSTQCGRKRCEKGAVLCQPWVRVHNCSSQFSQCRGVRRSTP